MFINKSLSGTKPLKVNEEAIGMIMLQMAFYIMIELTDFIATTGRQQALVD